MTLTERLKNIAAQRSQLAAEIKAAKVEELPALQIKADALTKEYDEVFRQQLTETLERVSAANPTPRVEDPTVYERQISDLRQNRAISIDAVDILHNTINSGNMKPAFQAVSSLIDLVGITPRIGVESFSQAYEKGFGMAGYTGEGEAYTGVEPTKGYAAIAKTKLTAYTEVPEEFEKLAPKMYLDQIKSNLAVSIKRKLTREMILGDGATGHITGVLSAAASAIESSKDLSVVAIDENTLDTIIFGYGGSEAVENGVLILSKADLLAFRKVRGTQDKKPVYDIDTKNQTINGVQYVISGDLPALSAAGTAANTLCMFYGVLSNYEVTLFSPLEVAKSTDFKFSTGQIAYKASGFFGGNVVSWNGFVRVKKVAA